MERLPDASRLVTFARVARHGSLTAAARSLGITTSAVSQQMAALETECGVRLLDREPRGAVLTSAGEVLLQRAEELVRHLDETATTMAQLGGELAGRVRVSTIASAAASIVLPATGVLERAAPAVTMSVTVREPQASLEAIADGAADLALLDVYDHVPMALPTHLLVEEVLTEPLVLVSATGSDLPRRPSLSALAAQTWVLPPATTACGAATRHACRADGFEPRTGWETDDLLLLVAAVSRGAGIALLPRRAVADSVAPVEIRRLVAPLLRRRLLLVTRSAASQRPIVRACLDAIHHVGQQAPSPPNTARTVSA